jgi:predicted enzyme related to lactoylglutathione lyase
MDLFTTDRRAAADFYRDLAGYQVDERQFSELTRLVLASQGYARAGIAPLPDEVDRPGWLPYVLVDDVRTTLERAQQAGGALLVEPAADLLDGRLAVFSDPSGGVIGILESSDSTEADQ